MGRKYPLHETIEKERQVLELRLQHATWKQIAERVGYASAGAAFNAYKRALVRTLQEPAEEIRAQERERLDRLAQYWFPKAFDPNDTDLAKTAGMMMLQIMDKRAKLLGLQTTVVKQDISITEGGNEFNERVKELAYLVARNRTDASGLDGGITPLLGGSSPS